LLNISLAKTNVSAYSNYKALTESAFPDSHERDGGWCEPGELTEQAVAPEPEAESRLASRAFPNLPRQGIGVVGL